MTLGKVLVVDDELEVRLVLQDFLADRGYEVSVVGSGALALTELGMFQPDVVLLDVTMPGMNGAETLTQIVARNPALPVIMVTGNVDMHLAAKLLALGAADYVAKPFDLEYLDQAIAIQLSAARDQ